MASLRLDRLWWWLALASLLCLLAHEAARSAGLGAASAAELEGFGEEADGHDEDDDGDDAGPPERRAYAPPPAHVRSGSQSDRGPPEPGAQREEEPEEDGGRRRTEGVAWDQDEFEGVPEEGKVAQDSAPSTPAKAARPQRRASSPLPTGPEHYILEALFVIFLVYYGVNYYFGRQENEKIALAWARQYAVDGGIFEKNFSLLGTGDGDDEPLLMKEGQSIFKLYGSGRRYCGSMLATMELRSRHDLISVLWYQLVPKHDEISFEVYMNDEDMDPFVFAVCKRKTVRTTQKDIKDLSQFGNILNTAVHPRWAATELAVISESREVAENMLTDLVVDQLFAEKNFVKYGSRLVGMHFTDQSSGPHKKVLKFKFRLPRKDDMGSISKLMAIVPFFIDQVGRFRLSANARTKADAARTIVEKEVLKERANERAEAIQKRKEEKLKEAERKRKEAESRLSPVERQRREERERQKQLKKALPKPKLAKVH